MTKPVKIMEATPGEYESIVELLTTEKLPVEDIDKDLPGFFVAKEAGIITGVIGLEVYDQYGLLRSMATHPAHRNKGIASALVKELIRYATRAGLKEVYLLTETAEAYFDKKEFVRIDRQQVADPVKQSREFSHLCPVSAVVMKKEIL